MGVFVAGLLLTLLGFLAGMAVYELIELRSQPQEAVKETE